MVFTTLISIVFCDYSNHITNLIICFACLRLANFTVGIFQCRKACWEVLTDTCVGLQGPTVLATLTQQELKFR